MEYTQEDRSKFHKYKRDDKIWFNIGDKRYAGIIKETFYITEVFTVDERIKISTDGNKYKMAKNKMEIRTNKRQYDGDYMMIDIRHISLDLMREITGGVNKINWEWDYNVVLGKVLSCKLAYKIVGQYRDNEPSFDNIMNEGEIYGCIDEDKISMRD